MKRITLAIVDDDMVSRSSIKKYLENSDKKVKVIAYDAAKLIEIYKKNKEETDEYEH